MLNKKRGGKKSKKARSISSKKKLRKPNFLIILFEIVKKDIKLLIRSKSSALVILFGPLLLIFLVGLAFNTSSLYNLKVDVYSETYSELTESVIESLGDEQYIVKKVDSEQNCIQGISLGESHICVVFPAGMTIDNAADNIVTYYVDESRTNLADLLSSTISSKIAEKSSELSLGLTNTIIQALDSTKKELENKKQILTALEQTVVSSKDKVEEIESKFANLDLEEESVNLSDAQDELEDLKDYFNSSASKFSELEELLDDAESGVALIQSKLTEVKSIRDSATQSFSETKTSLSTNIGNINIIKASFEKMKANLDAVKITNAESIVSPIKTSIKPLTPKKTHLSFLFPILVILVLMFIGILLASTIVTREKASPAYFRNFITPISDFTFMLGTYLTNLLLVIFQLIIILVAASYFLRNEILTTLLGSALVILASSTVFILIGMFLGYIFKSEETATLASIAVGSLMLFFSNTILPLESLPGLFNRIAQYNPFVIGQDLLKKVMLFNTDLSLLGNSFIMLGLYIVIFFVLALGARELTKRSFE